MADGSPWPSVSIVTPSYNQGQFIEETIRSVLLQGYPHLEYLIIDGGSTDGSVDIIRKYEPWLAYWVSEPDRGQSHAINKGWERATGDILAYLNSDDLYCPGAIGRAMEGLRENPEYALVYSDGLWIDETSFHWKPCKSGPLDARHLLTVKGTYIPQPTVFMRRSGLMAVGGLDKSLHMAMDFDLWVKLALRYPLGYLEGRPLAMLRDHALKKTSTRELEGLRCSLTVIDRGLQDPKCPPGITYRGNSVYAWLCLEMASFYFRKNKDYRNSIFYFLSAWKSQPAKTMRRLAGKGVVSLYRMLVPNLIQQSIRRLRGTENLGWLTRHY